MRKFIAYILIAITLLSNGMVDFAIKVCHDSDLKTGFKDNLEQEKCKSASISLKQAGLQLVKAAKRNSITKFSDTDCNQTKNTSEFDSSKLKKKKSCCSTQRLNKKSSNQSSIQEYSTNQESEDPLWDNLSSWIFTSDEHPCCRDNSKVQVKCCTLLNLYYFTPKFLEETTNYIPNILWKEVIRIDKVQYGSVVSKSLFQTECIERSDQYVPCFEDFSSSFCVWII